MYGSVLLGEERVRPVWVFERRYVVGARALATLGSVRALMRGSSGRTLFACVVHGSVLQSNARGNTLDKCPEWLRSPTASTHVNNTEVPQVYLFPAPRCPRCEMQKQRRMPQCSG